MPGAMHRMGVYLGLVEDDDYADADGYAPHLPSAPRPAATSTRRRATSARSTPVRSRYGAPREFAGREFDREFDATSRTRPSPVTRSPRCTRAPTTRRAPSASSSAATPR